MTDLREKFLDLQGIDNYQRVDPAHPLPLYIGLDSNAQYSLFCITDTEPKAIRASSVISVFVGKRRDGKFGITFSLTDKSCFDQFVHFCDDTIDASRKVIDLHKASDFLMNRYLIWQKAFAKNNNGLLSAQEIKGLIGELCFLQKYMIPVFGEEKAIGCWVGPDMADQDFVCDGTWYEVKSTVSGASSVKISSVEQLDTDRDGHLVVVRLDKTSSEDSSKITINNLYTVISESLSSSQLRDHLKTTLLRLGYYKNKIYEQYCFHYNGMDTYRVNTSFPCARKKDFAPAVQDVHYDLSLAAIEKFKEGGNSD